MKLSKSENNQPGAVNAPDLHTRAKQALAVGYTCVAVDAKDLVELCESYKKMVDANQTLMNRVHELEDDLYGDSHS
jgi:hypothetical protein